MDSDIKVYAALLVISAIFISGIFFLDSDNPKAQDPSNTDIQEKPFDTSDRTTEDTQNNNQNETENSQELSPDSENNESWNVKRPNYTTQFAEDRIRPNEDISDIDEENYDCGNFTIEFKSISAGSATVEQTSGNYPVGNVSVEWFYRQGSAEKFLYINTTSGKETAVSSSSSRRLRAAIAVSLACGTKVNATYR